MRLVGLSGLPVKRLTSNERSLYRGESARQARFDRFNGKPVRSWFPGRRTSNRRETPTAQSGRLEFHAESLDIVRFPSESYQRLFRDYLRDKYAHDLPDLIILVYVGNLGIAEKLLGELFPKAPVVVVGLTELGIQNKVSV